MDHFGRSPAGYIRKARSVRIRVRVRGDIGRARRLTWAAIFNRSLLPDGSCRVVAKMSILRTPLLLILTVLSGRWDVVSEDSLENVSQRPDVLSDYS